MREIGIFIAIAIVIAIPILIHIAIIQAICKYMAKQNSKSFDYDFMARRIAEEVCKRLLLIEKQKNNRITDTEAQETTAETTPDPS